MSDQLSWLLISRYQFLRSNPSSPSISQRNCPLMRNNNASPWHQHHIMKSAKAEIYRQTAGMGTRSFTMPASVMGMEHNTVTRMVSMTEMIKITGVNNLGMIMG